MDPITPADVEFAKASTKVSQAELEKDIESNKKVPGSVTDVEVNRAELTVTKSKLSIDKAQMDRRIAALTAKVKEAEAEATDLAIALPSGQREEFRVFGLAGGQR